MLADDPVITRLRAADPADGGPVPSHAAVERAIRGRRSRGARRAGAGGTVAAVCAALVLPFGGAGAPALADVVARASDAAAPAPGSIVEVVSRVQVVSTGAVDDRTTQRRVVWVHVGAGGRTVASRTLIDDRFDEVSRDGAVESYDLDTGETRRVEGMRAIPSLVFRAAELLGRARRGGAELAEETVGGRRAHRLVVTGVDEAPVRPGDREELLVDAETYAPIELRKHSEGEDVHGEPFTYDLTETVVSRRTLPDDAEHRRLLELRGPTG